MKVLLIIVMVLGTITTYAQRMERLTVQDYKGNLQTVIIDYDFHEIGKAKVTHNGLYLYKFKDEQGNQVFMYCLPKDNYMSYTILHKEEEYIALSVLTY
jgi:hypothetical protein